MDAVIDAYRPVEWTEALRAMIGLARDTSRTDHVFAIIRALSGDSFERTYQEFITTPYGQRLLTERPSLMDALSDRESLRAMPSGSLGRAYLEFMESGRLTAEGLVAAQEAAIDPNEGLVLDADRRYVADRLRDMHDLWHVLSGYGMDDSGEIANLWFSVGQFVNPGMAFIAFMGTLGGHWDPSLGWQRYCYRAFQRGRSAARLICEPLEAMLPVPLEEVRSRLAIEAPEKAHPEGIRTGYRAHSRLGAPARAA